MKLRFSQTIKPFFILLLLVSMLLIHCQPLQAGQVKGKLVADGKPLRGYPIAIELIPTSEHAKTSMHLINTDGAGNFLVKSAQPGRYIILLAKISMNASTLSFYVVLKNGSIYTFELPEGKGIDLGTVDASARKFWQKSDDMK